MTDAQETPASADNVALATPNTPETPADPSLGDAASWRDGLPDDLKESASLSKFETVEGLAKSYTSLEKMLGSDKVTVPKDGDEESLDKWYKAAGWPEDAKGYEFKQPEEVPEGMEYDEALDGRLQGILHEAKLDKRQASAVREELMKMVGEGVMDNMDASKLVADQQEQAIAESEATLQKEWGKAYEQNAKIAGRAINQLFGDDLEAVFNEKGLGNHPALIRAAHEMGKKLIGEKELIGEGLTEPTPGDLDSRISDFRTTHAAALNDASHSDHKLRVQEMTKLYDARYG